MVCGSFESSKSWSPLEADPDVFNDYAQKLGLDTDQYAFCDIFGFDEDLLEYVPRPVLAVLVVKPLVALVEGEPEVVEDEQDASGVYFIKQTFSNSGGTIGLLHAIANNSDALSLAEDSFLMQFLEATQEMDAVERAVYLESPPEGEPDIDDYHQEASGLGTTAAPEDDDDVSEAYSVFICKDETLYELDPYKPTPTKLGPTSDDTLLEDALAAVQYYIEENDFAEAIGNISLMALTTPISPEELEAAEEAAEEAEDDE